MISYISPATPIAMRLTSLTNKSTSDGILALALGVAPVGRGNVMR